MAKLKKNKLNVGRFAAVFNGAKADAQVAAKASGELILKNTLPFTPMEYGDLRETGRINTLALTDKITVVVSFGGDNAPYAAIVHEDMQPKNFTTPGTGPKYLSHGVDISVKDVNELLQNSLKTALRKGSR